MDKKKNISNKLEEIKKENSFFVPDGYFDSFQQRLNEKIKSGEEDKIPGTSTVLMPRLVWISAVAAVFIIAFFVAQNIIGLGSSIPLSQEEIAYAFEQEIYDLDELELIENLDDAMQDQESEKEYSEEIILYLIDEDIEIDKIVNEL